MQTQTMARGLGNRQDFTIYMKLKQKRAADLCLYFRIFMYAKSRFSHDAAHLLAFPTKYQRHRTQPNNSH